MSATRLRTRGAKCLRPGRSLVQRSGQSGFALLIALLLLTLMSALGLIMALSINSDMLINGYYGNYRGSFYAADSGLSIARAQLANQVMVAVNTTPCASWGAGSTAGCTNLPLAASTAASSALSYIMASANYGSFTGLNTGVGENSWPASFKIADNLPLANGTSCVNSFSPGATTPTGGNGYNFAFNYTLCAIARAGGMQHAIATESGVINIAVTPQSSNTEQTTVSFSSFGGFVNNWAPCTLGWLVPGLMAGPMFTNGSWGFGLGGVGYTFTDPVSQHNANASYWVNGCTPSPTASYTNGGQTVAPNFMQGLLLNQPVVSAPANSFSQQWAVIDGLGCGEGSNVCGQSTSPAPPQLQAADLNAHLMDINGNPYPATGATSGVYLSSFCTAAPCAGGGSPNTIDGGGFYVEGDASVVMLTSGAETSLPLLQIYTVTQGSTVTTITVNNTAQTTTIASGSTIRSLAGVPENKVPTLTGSPQQPGTLLYVDGKLALTGPGQGQPAVQDYSQVTLVASGNVNITGDVIYAHEPVTMDTANALIPGNDYNQVLGIYTANGNIDTTTTYANHNLQVDGSLAPVGASTCPTCGFTVSSGYVNTFNNVGGQIQTNIYAANMSVENTYYDRRFVSKKNFGPPWFPTTQVSQAAISSALAPSVSATFQRRSWTTSPQ